MNVNKLSKIKRLERHKKYINDIKNGQIECLGEYVTASTKIPHRCKKCGYGWDQSPHVIKRAKKCPYCAGNLPLDTSTYKKQISNLPLECIGEYINSHTKIKHRCKKCSCIWSVKPENVKGVGSGCPKCHKAKQAYRTYKNRVTILYLIDVVGVGIKPGLTLTSINERYIKDGVNLEEMSSVVYNDGHKAWKMEQFILNETKQGQLFNIGSSGPLVAGNTEIRDYKFATVMMDFFDELSKDQAN